MAGQIVLESFVTAVACLCASSFRPNSNIKDVEHNIYGSLTKFDTDVLQLFINSKDVFQFATNSDECPNLNGDTVGMRLSELESAIEKQKKLSKKLEEQLDGKNFLTANSSQMIDDKAMKECEKVGRDKDEIIKNCQQNNTVLLEKNEMLFDRMKELNVAGVYSIILNCTQQNSKLSAEINANREKYEKEILECTAENEKLKKFNKNEPNGIGENHNSLNANSKKKITELNEENNKLKLEKEELSAEISKLRKEINDLKENENKHNSTTLKNSQNIGKVGDKLQSCQLNFDYNVESCFGTGWILISQRSTGEIHFYRGWNEYSAGFGYRSEKTEFFIGLEELYTITNSGSFELLFILTDEQKQTRYARYDNFLIGNKTEEFRIMQLGKYEGDAGDSFSYHVGQKFSTWDRDNDEEVLGNCAKIHTGAWWYKDCHESNLFGLHKNRRSKSDLHKRNGMIWSAFHNTDDGGLILMRMYLRRKANEVSKNI